MSYYRVQFSVCVTCGSSEEKRQHKSLCVDYRKLTKLTVFDPEPMPTAEHLFQKLIGDNFYSKIVDFYWDDILVHTRTWEEHIRALRELFSRLVQAGLTIGPTKCLFGVNSVDFLGHRLEQEMIGLHQDNVEKIKDAPRPSTKVRSFMGLAGYYRDFIPNFTAIAVPLSDGVKHNRKPTEQSGLT